MSAIAAVNSVSVGVLMTQLLLVVGGVTATLLLLTAALLLVIGAALLVTYLVIYQPNYKDYYIISVID